MNMVAQSEPGIVAKPWGYEYCAYDDGECAVWVLHIARKRKTSFHCHPNKTSRLVVLQGVVSLRIGDKVQKLLGPLQWREIPKGVYHMTEATPEDGSTLEPASENGAVVLEIEEPSNKGDIRRADDAYGREGKPIEAPSIRYDEPLLKLSTSPSVFLGYTLKIENTFGGPIPDLLLKMGSRVLGIYSNKTVRVADYVADFIAGLGIKHVFSVCGGGAMHLVDAFGRHQGIEYIATHHEQAAAMAAESYARFNGLGCALVTTGPGGTNALTGLACAWVDSIPVLFISGQVTSNALVGVKGAEHLRQFGVQETHIIPIVRSQTKYAVRLESAEDIRWVLEQAAWLAVNGRPGPVWIDIPLDMQSARVRHSDLRRFKPPTVAKPDLPLAELDAMLSASSRPVLLFGNGVRLAGADNSLRALVDQLGIPVVSSWTAQDMLAHDHPLHIGHCGIFGDRASNFAVQNADFLLVIGSRLSVPQIGYRFDHFARGAKIAMVDVSSAEIDKPSLKVSLRIVSDAGHFLRSWSPKPVKVGKWLARCQDWKRRYPVVLPEYATNAEGVNSFHFMDWLSERLPHDAVVVTDMGTAFTCTMQTLRVSPPQRLSTASGHAPMGYGLPGAIGAHFATGKPVVCIVGDGALQFNIQELQTIAHHDLPIMIFLLNNNGYLTIKHMQQNHFGLNVGADPASGLSCPDTMAIAQAYGFAAERIHDQAELDAFLMPAVGQAVIEIMMPENQALIPKLSSYKRPDGTITAKPLEDLYPFLDREEFAAQMLVPPVEGL